MDELEVLYNTYRENGLLSKNTSLDVFKKADSKTIESLYQQGVENNLVSKKTDLSTFNSAWDKKQPVKKKENFNAPLVDTQSDISVPNQVGSLESNISRRNNFEFFETKKDNTNISDKNNLKFNKPFFKKPNTESTFSTDEFETLLEDVTKEAEQRIIDRENRIKSNLDSFKEKTKFTQEDELELKDRIDSEKTISGFENFIDGTLTSFKRSIGLPSSVAETKTIPFEKEIKQVKDYAKKNNLEFSNEEILKKAEEIFIEKERDKIFNDKANSFLSELDPDSKGEVQNLLNTSIKGLSEENQKIVKTNTALKDVLISGDKELKERADFFRKNPNNITDKDVLNFNLLRDDLIEKSKIYNRNQEKLISNTKDLQTLEKEYDLFRRSYDGVFLKNFAISTSELIVGGIDFINFLGQYSNPVIPIPNQAPLFDTSKIREELKQDRENIRKPIESVESLDGFLNYMSDLVANQLSNFLATSTGYGGLAVIGASSTGQKYAEMTDDIKSGKAEYNAWQMMLVPIGHGSAEAIFEIPTLSILKKGKRVLNAAIKETPSIFKAPAKETFKSFGADFLKENFAEQGTNLIQNGLNIYALGQEGNLLDNSLDVLKDTSTMTLLLQGAPHIMSKALKPFHPKDNIKILEDNAFKMQQLYQDLKNAEITDVEKSVIENQIQRLTKSSSDIMRKTIFDVSEMDNETRNDILDINKRAGEIRFKANEILENGNSKNKESLLSDLEREHQLLQEQREKILLDYNNKPKKQISITINGEKQSFNTETFKEFAKNDANIQGIIDGDIDISINNDNESIELLNNRTKELSSSKKKAYDFDDTLFDNSTQELNDLGKEVKSKIESGEDITIVSARENTPENIQIIADKLGVNPDKIKLVGKENQNSKKAQVLDELGIDRKNFVDVDSEKQNGVANSIDTKNVKTIPIGRLPNINSFENGRLDEQKEIIESDKNELEESSKAKLPKQNKSSDIKTEFVEEFTNSVADIEDLSDVGKDLVSVKKGDTTVIIKETENEVVLESIETKEESKGKGNARKVIEEIVDVADKQDKTVKLKVVPKNENTSESKLVEFYESEGFVKSEDFDTSKEMIRKPINEVKEIKSDDNYFDPAESEGESIGRLTESITESDSDAKNEQIKQIAKNHTNSYLDYLKEQNASKQVLESEFVKTFEKRLIGALKNPDKFNFEQPRGRENGSRVDENNNEISELDYLIRQGDIDSTTNEQTTQSKNDTVANADIRPATETSKQTKVQSTANDNTSKKNVKADKKKYHKIGRYQYSIENIDGNIVVKSKLGSKTASKGSKVYKEAIEIYKNETDFSKGELADLNFKGSQQEYNDVIAEKSNNPQEIARAIREVRDSNRDNSENLELTKQGAIAESLKGVVIDKRNHNEVTDLSFPYRVGAKKEVKTIDKIRESAQEIYGQEVEYQDVLDFLEENSSVSDYFEKTRNDFTQDESGLEVRFEKVTGLKATTENIEKVYNQQPKAEQESQEQTEEDTESDVPFQTESTQERIKGQLLRDLINRLKATGLAGSVFILNSKQFTDKLKQIGKNYINIPNGFIYNNEVYLNESEIKYDTPIHEFSHLWLNLIKDNNPDLYNRGLELISENIDGKENIYLEQARRINKENNTNLTEEQILNEALAQAIGEKGVQLNKSLKDKITFWFKRALNRIAKGFGLREFTQTQLNNLNLDTFLTSASAELLKGENIKTKEKSINISDTNIERVLEVQDAILKEREKTKKRIDNKNSEEKIVKKAIKDYINEVLKINNIKKVSKDSLKKLSSLVEKSKTEINYDSALSKIDEIVNRELSSKAKEIIENNNKKNNENQNKKDISSFQKLLIKRVKEQAKGLKISSTELASITNAILNANSLKKIDSTVKRIDDKIKKLKAKKFLSDKKLEAKKEQQKSKERSIKEQQKLLEKFKETVVKQIKNSVLNDLKLRLSLPLIETIRKAKSFKNVNTLLSQTLIKISENEIKLLDKSITDLLNTKNYTKIENGKSKAKKISNDKRKIFKDIIDFLEKDSLDLQQKKSEIENNLDGLNESEYENAINTIVAIETALYIKESNELLGLSKEDKSDYSNNIKYLDASKEIKQNTLNNLEAFLLEGKYELKQQIEKEAKRKREIAEFSIKATEHRFSNVKTTQQKNELREHKNKRFVKFAKEIKDFSKKILDGVLMTFEFTMKYIDQLQDGKMYEHFYTKGILKADGEYSFDIAESRKERHTKLLEIFKDRISKYKLKQGYDLHKFAKDSLRQITNTGIYLTIDGKTDVVQKTLSKANALAIYQMSKMEENTTALELQGYDREAMVQLKKFLGDDYIAYGDYMTDYLKSKYEKYNKIHLELFGTDLGKTDNYFPTIKDKSEIAFNFEIGELKFRLPHISNNNIKNKTHNNLPLDENLDAFTVFDKYIDGMEKLYHYGRFAKDMSSLLSNKKFKNNLETYDKNVFESFKIATENALGNRQDSEVEKRNKFKVLYTINSGIAVGYISYRLFTAFKQTASAIVYAESASKVKIGSVPIPYLGGLSFIGKTIGQMINPFTWKKNRVFFKKHSKNYKDRVEKGNAGDEFILSYLNNDGSLFGKMVRGFVQVGIKPNKIVDAFTIASAGKILYNQQYKKYQKYMSKEDAHKKAIEDFDIMFRTTQQSSNNSELGDIQINKSGLGAFITVFKNSQFGYMRKMIDKGGNVSKRYKRNKKEAIDNGLSKKQAIIKGYKSLATEETFDDINNMLLYSSVVSAVWSLTSQIPSLITNGWEDDDEELLNKSIVLGFSEGIPVVNELSSYLYDTQVRGKDWDYPTAIYKDFTSEMTKEISDVILEDDIINKDVISKIANLSLTITNVLAKTKGVNSDTWLNIYNGTKELIIDNDEDGLDYQSIFRIANTPKSSLIKSKEVEIPKLEKTITEQKEILKTIEKELNNDALTDVDIHKLKEFKKITNRIIKSSETKIFNLNDFKLKDAYSIDKEINDLSLSKNDSDEVLIKLEKLKETKTKILSKLKRERQKKLAFNLQTFRSILKKIENQDTKSKSIKDKNSLEYSKYIVDVTILEQDLNFVYKNMTDKTKLLADKIEKRK